MSRWILAVFCLVIVAGCAEKPEPLAEPPAGKQDEAVTQVPGGQGQESVGVVSPAAGLSSPVTGSDSVTGAGGGGSVGQAAKDQARSAASKAGGSSLDQYSDN